MFIDEASWGGLGILIFPTLRGANNYLNQHEDKIGMMVSPLNVKDIFGELTGRQLD